MSADSTSTALLLTSFKLRADADLDTLGQLWLRMHELVTSSPEFAYLGSTTYSAADGSSLIVYRFRSSEGMEAFERHADHDAVQRRAAEFFEWMRNEVCIVTGDHPWKPSRASEAAGPPAGAPVPDQVNGQR